MKYKVRDWTVEIKLSDDKLTGVYYKKEDDVKQGSLDLSKNDDLYKGGYADPNGKKGVLHIRITDDGFWGRWSANVDSDKPKGNWDGVKMEGANSKSTIERRMFENYKCLNVFSISDEAIENEDIFEAVIANFFILSDEDEESFIMQYNDPNNTISDVCGFEDEDEMHEFIDKKLVDWLSIETWEAAGLTCAAFKNDTEVLDEEDVVYCTSDGGEFDFEDDVSKGMKGVGLIYSSGNKIEYKDAKIVVNGDEVDDMGSIMGYLSSDNDEIILLD